MALQQPTRQAVQRVARAATAEDGGIVTPARPVDESQTWVLFSPPTDVTTASCLSGSAHALDTPGRSQLSDLGSLHTATRSVQLTDARQSTALSAMDDASAEDDAELDSLDSHLPEFRSLPGAQPPSHADEQHAVPVLPAHDGLGSFRLDRPALGREAQDHIYQFERFNPRRVRRRLDSPDRGHAQAVHGPSQEEKRLRIEAWRMEHSRILLDEVQRETRRRRKSQASLQRFQRPAEAESDNMAWHDEDAMQSEAAPGGLLARMTRKVVKDLLGIDDALLSVLLGESAVGEGDASTTRPASRAADEHLPGAAGDSSWQLRILERLSRELGLLMKHMSHQPGAFSTYSRMQQMALPYAGLPVIPESADGPPAAEAAEAERRRAASVPEFQPTMHQDAQAMSTPSRRVDEASDAAADDVDMDKTFTKDEWERSLDVKLVFRYLISRFTWRSKTPAAASAASAAGPRAAGTPTAQDSVAKMTRVRQQHPLIARSRPAAERRCLKATLPASPAALRHHSSCASQSTRRSARRSSCSSRHYWDIGGGSLGTGSMMGPGGPMGSWGEV